MAHIVLFHSILGLRPVEHAVAAQLERHGHRVSLPDLFGGLATDDYDTGFAQRKAVGTAAILKAAKAAVDAAPETAVLAGVSFGASLISEFWGARPRMAGALLIAGVTDWMAPRRAGFPMSVHVARPDPFDDAAFFADWAGEAAAWCWTCTAMTGSVITFWIAACRTLATRRRSFAWTVRWHF